MDISSVIQNLSSPDNSKRSDAIQQCEFFLDPKYFDYNIFRQFSCSKSIETRIFIYNSLSFIFKNSFNCLPNNVQLEIIKDFPFHKPEDLENVVLLNIITETIATFLAYVGELDLVVNFFNYLKEASFNYMTKITVTFFVLIWDDKFPVERTSLLNNFVLNNFESLLFVPVIKQFIINDFYEDNLESAARIHSVPSLVDFIVNNIYTDDVYSKLGNYLWFPSKNNYTLSIIYSILEFTEKLPKTFENIFNNIVYIPDIYQSLFCFQEENLENYIYLCNNLSLRVLLLFKMFKNILKNNKEEKIISLFLNIFMLLLNINVPYIIELILSKLIKIKTLILQNILDIYRNSLLEIFISLIKSPMKEMQGAFYGDWSNSSILNYLIDLSVYLITFDGYDYIHQIFQLIFDDGVQSLSFQGLVYILNKLFSTEPSHELILLLKDDVMNLTIFLLSSIQYYTPTLQSQIFKLLKKLIPFLIFDDEDLNIFYKKLIELYTIGHSIEFNNFSQYIMLFTEFFHERIYFNKELIDEIKKGNSCYNLLSSFITKYSKKEGKDLINDFQKLLELFSNNDIMSKKLSGKISHSFYLLSIISLNEESLVNEYFELIIKLHNSIINICNSTNTLFQTGKELTILSQFDPAFNHFLKLYSNLFVDNYQKIIIPNKLNGSLPFWIEHFATQLIVTISKIDTNISSKLAISVSEKIYSLIQENMQQTTNTAILTLIKKILVFLPDFSLYINDGQYVLKYLKFCLNNLNDDFKIFISITHVLEVKDIFFLKLIWDDINKTLSICSDNKYVDKVSSMLCQIYSNYNYDSQIFNFIPSKKEFSTDELQKQLYKQKSTKKIRRIFRNYLIVQE